MIGVAVRQVGDHHPTDVAFAAGLAVFVQDFDDQAFGLDVVETATGHCSAITPTSWAL